MKKTLLFLSVLMSAMTGLQAQCTITPSCTLTNGYCTTPAAGTALPNATELMAYSTVIQVSIGTTVSGATINSATITSVSGLPTGLTYSTNPTSGVIMGGANGCILITGTPASATAGSYTVTANESVNTNFGVFPTTSTWLLTVNGSAGITHIATPAVNFFLMPNPAKSEINLSADFSFGKVLVFDVLGKVVLTHQANNSYQTAVDLHDLNSGIYFVQVADGNKTITRKFIKE